MGIEREQIQHCVEIVTGRGLTGKLLVGEREIRAEIFSYDKFFYIKGDSPIHLIAQTGETVSLHDVVVVGTCGGHPSAVYSQSLIANVAIVGHDPWTESDRVKRVTFSVTHTMPLVRNNERFEGLGRTRYPSAEHLSLFRDKAKGMTLCAGYSGTWRLDFDVPKDIRPIFEIEFDEPQEISYYIRRVYHFVCFLSFCLGVKLRPHNIMIDRLSLDEARQVEEDLYRPPHKVYYVWAEAEIDSGDVWGGASPVLAYDEKELNAFRACLITWMDREAEWRSSYAMMMSSYALSRQVSAERLINACRWFEELPNARSKPSLAEEHVEEIAAAASLKAVELGLDAALRDRIAGSIKRIKEETAAERFTRLIAMVEEKFGKGVLPGDTLNHLRKAIQFRGRTAHGHFYPENDADHRAFLKATLALEALCCLLTAHDLPIAKAGLERMRANPPVRDYCNAYE
ncbi:hypothetical protein WI697_17315 [Tistrella mobilis]|uniref:ApeA N-terminal domain 1-containing protein n=1 Tax=Tistrella mobilis TaxID=171437 RepID=UPI0031F71248